MVIENISVQRRQKGPMVIENISVQRRQKGLMVIENIYPVPLLSPNFSVEF